MSTRIASVRTDIIRIPLPEVIGNHPFLGERTAFVTLVVRIRTAAGIEGFGYVTAESERQMRAVALIVEDFTPALVGADALHRTAIAERLKGMASELLREGAATMALATVDLALWDIFGKETGLSIADLIGRRRDRVPAYASHGLWRHLSKDRLQRDASQFVDQGFRAIKLRLGNRPVDEDVERVRLVREAVGPNIAILSDAIWSMSPLDAVRMVRALEPCDLTWIEDPVAEDDLAALADVRSRSQVPIASGERISRLPQLEQMLAANAIDHLILDLHHLGGITPWLAAAAMAETRSLPISAHITHELQVPLLASVRNVGFLEYFPYWEVLYEEPPRVEDGHIQVPEGSGFGLAIDEAALERLSVA